MAGIRFVFFIVFWFDGLLARFDCRFLTGHTPLPPYRQVIIAYNSL
jgi:hypothetical protein